MLWKVIQKNLDKRHWSLKVFSKKSGVPFGTLKNYKFKNSDPSFTNACKIVDALDISLDELRERRD